MQNLCTLKVQNKFNSKKFNDKNLIFECILKMRPFIFPGESQRCLQADSDSNLFVLPPHPPHVNGSHLRVSEL